MMRRQVISCSAALRLGRQAEASSLLMPLLEAVAERLDSLPTGVAGDVQQSLSRALHCQQSQDLIALADELEHVLLPLIEPAAASHR